jgi:hypothetical protein
MEEAWQGVFRNLYTGFLLRDFAGKIIPGIVLLFSISTIFQDMRNSAVLFTKKIPVASLILISGLAWIVTLGTQSLAEGIGVWRYFPAEKQQSSQEKTGFMSQLLGPGDEQAFDKNTMQIDEFQSKATEDEKQQYERFVVIKEACGNLFVACLISIPALFLGYLLRNPKITTYLQTKLPAYNYLPSGKGVLLSFYVLIIMIGLHLMHAQHVHRQFSYAENLVKKHANSPAPNAHGPEQKK